MPRRSGIDLADGVGVEVAADGFVVGVPGQVEEIHLRTATVYLNAGNGRVFYQNAESTFHLDQIII